MDIDNNYIITSSKELKKAFLELGWRHEKDSVGENSYIIRINNIDIDVTARIKPRDTGKRIELYYSVVFEKFTSIVNFIDNGIESNFCPIVSKSYRNTYSIFRFSDISSICNEITNWAISVDLDSVFSEFREKIPTTGQAQLYHLASLVMNKEIDRLKEYHESFLKGDKLGFCPMITQDMIDRALEIAINENLN